MHIKKKKKKTGLCVDPQREQRQRGTPDQAQLLLSSLALQTIWGWDKLLGFSAGFFFAVFIVIQRVNI